MAGKITAPVARSTAYDFNVQLAKSHLQQNVHTQCLVDARDPEVRDVMPHEILFAQRKDVDSTDSRLRCMSSLNGVQIDDRAIAAVNEVLPDGMKLFGPDATSIQKASLLEMLDKDPILLQKVNRAFSAFFVYIGVAITPCKAGQATALQRQGFSATRGGLMTVMNTGHHTISAGKKVCMILDVRDVLRGERTLQHRIEGVPKTKILARLEVASNNTSDLLADVMNAQSNFSLVDLVEPFPLVSAAEYQQFG